MIIKIFSINNVIFNSSEETTLKFFIYRYKNPFAEVLQAFTADVLWWPFLAFCSFHANAVLEAISVKECKIQRFPSSTKPSEVIGGGVNLPSTITFCLKVLFRQIEGKESSFGLETWWWMAECLNCNTKPAYNCKVPIRQLNLNTEILV